MKTVKILGFLLACYAMLCTSTSMANEVAPKFSFAIGPQQSPSELVKRWGPILQYISEKTGIQLEFKTAKDIPTFQQQMEEGAFDFAFINPHHYIVSQRKVGYQAFAQELDGKLVGVIVVSKGGPIQTLEQLQGQTVAFPAVSAIAATWLPMHYLKEQNIHVMPNYVNSMDSVYRGVAKGLFVAGGGETRTLGTIDPEVRSRLRILWESQVLPPFVFAAHPRVPKEIVAKVQRIMDEMDGNDQGKTLLKTVNFRGMRKASDADYDVMRKMNIKPVVAKPS